MKSLPTGYPNMDNAVQFVRRVADMADELAAYVELLEATIEDRDERIAELEAELEAKQ